MINDDSVQTARSERPLDFEGDPKENIEVVALRECYVDLVMRQPGEVFVTLREKCSRGVLEPNDGWGAA